MKKILYGIIIYISLIVANLYSASNYYKIDSSKIKEIKQSIKYKKLSYQLNQIIKLTETNNLKAAVQSAKVKGMLIKDNEITVIVEGNNEGEVNFIQNEITAKKGKVLSKYNNLLKIRISITNLKELNNINKIKKVREPYKPIAHTIDGEQIQLTGAKSIQSNGYTGVGIKVAVIDGGFQYYQTAIANGELPGNVITYDFSGTGIDTDSEHGTAVAEVIYEIAPACQLYLFKIGDDVDLGNAKNYCIANGINIINHSMGWVNTEWGNGTGSICSIANDANNNGILWVNSAGNAAQMHYQANFNNVGDESHNFGSGNNINSIGTVAVGNAIRVFLSWNDLWGGSVNDYDFQLYRWTGSWTYVTGSYNDQQGGYPDPTEVIGIYAPSTAEYGILIYKWSGVDQELQLFSFYQDFNYQTAARSLMAPADASGVFTIGAIEYSSWLTGGPIESFSSRGPTQDGRIKPDISGVDGNLNSIYGRFYGTSSASPCVAGCAALKWGADRIMTHNQIRQFLRTNAIDMGALGPDNDYGVGRVNLVKTNFDTLPSVTICTPSPDKIRWKNSDIQLITLEAEAKIYYSITGEDPQPNINYLYTKPITLDQPITIKYFSVDKAGNKEILKSTYYPNLEFLEPKQSVMVYNNLLYPYDNQKNKMFIVFREANNYNIKLYNINGEIIKEWASKNYNNGEYLEWDGRVNGELVNANMYIVKVKSNSFEQNFKVLVVK